MAKLAWKIKCGAMRDFEDRQFMQKVSSTLNLLNSFLILVIYYIPQVLTHIFIIKFFFITTKKERFAKQNLDSITKKIKTIISLIPLEFSNNCLLSQKSKQQMFAVYGILANAETIRNALTKFTQTYRNELSHQDQQLLSGVERRVNSLTRPLSCLLIQNQQSQNDSHETESINQSHLMTGSLDECLQLIYKIRNFLSNLQGQNSSSVNQSSRQNPAAQNTQQTSQLNGQVQVNLETLGADLQFFSSELDSATNNLLLCIQIQNSVRSQNSAMTPQICQNIRQDDKQEENINSQTLNRQNDRGKQSYRGLSLNSFMKASHRLRDLSCVNSGYLFSRAGSLFLLSNSYKKTLLIHDCFFGMKFDPKINKFVIEIRGISSLDPSQNKLRHNDDLVENQVRNQGIKRPQKLTFELSYSQLVTGKVGNKLQNVQNQNQQAQQIFQNEDESKKASSGITECDQITWKDQLILINSQNGPIIGNQGKPVIAQNNLSTFSKNLHQLIFQFEAGLFSHESTQSKFCLTDVVYLLRLGAYENEMSKLLDSPIINRQQLVHTQTNNSLFGPSNKNYSSQANRGEQASLNSSSANQFGEKKAQGLWSGSLMLSNWEQCNGDNIQKQQKIQSIQSSCDVSKIVDPDTELNQLHGLRHLNAVDEELLLLFQDCII